jgi:hypothetical protein
VPLSLAPRPCHLTPNCVGVLSDATKSVSRAYINNFQDKGKQIAIDMFLVCFVTFTGLPVRSLTWGSGNLSNQTQATIFDPIHDTVRAALDARLSLALNPKSSYRTHDVPDFQ